MTQNQVLVDALGLPQMKGITAVSKMFESTSVASMSALDLPQMKAITAVSKMFDSATATSVSALGLSHMKGIAAASKMFESASAWSAWKPILQDGSVLASAVADLQISNAATADAFAAVAAQRIVALNRGAQPGSFDAQFAAITRRFGPADFPSHLRDQFSVEEDDAQVTEIAAANMGLSAVPSNPGDRLMLEILLGFVFMMLYGAIQLGMTGDPITPSFVLETAAAGGLGFKSVTWAPQALEKLKNL